MKKVLTFAALCFGLFTTANAQYSPEKGDFAVEVGFTPFESGGETFKLNEGMLKARYFLTDKDALRLKIGLGIDNTTNTVTNTSDPFDKTVAYTISESTKETKDKHTDFSFMLGYERHLFTTGRFDFFAGLELGYGLDKYSGTETIEGSSKSFGSDGKPIGSTTQNDETDYHNKDTKGVTSKNYFSGNLFAGVDFYVWKNLYLGAECGLNFKTGKSPNTYENYTINRVNYNANGEFASSTVINYDGETNTTVTITKNGSSESTNTSALPYTSNKTTKTSFNLFVEPAIRIGWRF
jgi:hypothetical protein